MAWDERIREAALTSPTGKRLVYDWENVRREFDRKAATFDFPGAAGTLVQDLGRSGRRYPLRALFWGDDYDQDAAEFEALLTEPGVFVLEHPVYGRHDVMPVGTITRRDDLVTQANQAVIEATLYEVSDAILPAQGSDPSAQVNAALDAQGEAQAEALAQTANLETAADRAGFQGRYTAALDQARSALRTVADAQDSVRREFDAIDRAINTGIDVLVAEPLTLAFETRRLIQAPALAADSIRARLDAYGNLASSVIDNAGNITPDSRNTVASVDLFATGATAGAVLSAADADAYETRGEAVEAAGQLFDLLQTVTDWRDEAYNSAGLADPGGSIQALTDAVARAAGLLVALSFDLSVEKALITDRPRTLVDVAAELYGSVDDRLDLLIDSNRLTGSEILLIPRGRRLVYYV